MKKRGFTLIELLAVILILGIIALIAIPIVSNIIKESKRGAFETTANNVVSAVEDACQLQTLKGETLTTTYTFSDGVVSPSLNIKGKLPAEGTVTVNSSCNVELNVTNGNFTATKTLSDDKIVVVYGIETSEPETPEPEPETPEPEPPKTYTVYANGTAVYFNPVTGAKCTSGEAVSTTGTKTGCMKWYTFNDGGDTIDTINLILDHNTSTAVAWNSSESNVNGPANVMTQLATDTSSWSGVPTRTDSYSVSNGTATYTINYGTYKARLITAGEIATITGNSNFAEATTPYSGWYYLDSNSDTRIAKTTGASNYDWLFDYTNGCTSYGCNINDVSNIGWWTSTAVFGVTVRAWSMSSMGLLDYNYVYKASGIGVRPVITISKSNL